jgi:hypothetical protein
MKYSLSVLLFTSLILANSASAQTEEQCKKSAQVSIEAIELIEKQTGVEQKIQGLSIKEIRSIEEKNGSCAAMQEINKRTMK